MGWTSEDDVEHKQQVQKEIARRQQRGELLESLKAPAGSQKLCTTFWGQAWCRNLEAYQHYEARLPRGRSYLRQGKVYNLHIQAGEVSAIVAGSRLYETRILIQPLPQAQWQDIVHQSAGAVASMLDLLAGKLGDGLMRVLTDTEHGLFPKPKEIRFDCTCPDYADLCKHSAAVLYGVGVLLDGMPELLFTLRQVDQAELLTHASQATAADLAMPLSGLEGADLSALFGIDLKE
jgi:uncharacterized Zn finger protein